MRCITLLSASLIAALLPCFAFGQGFVVPPERQPFAGAYVLRTIAVDAKVKDQVAEVQLAQVLQNSTAQQMEVSYLFPVPPDAVINQFTLLIDDKEVPAKLYTKEDAQRIYESIVRTKKDPALLEYAGYGAIQTRIFPIPPHGQRKITLRYSQICRRNRDVTEFLFPLSSGKLSSRPVEDLRITVRLENLGRIKSVYSPTYPVSIERPDDHSAIARFAATHASVGEDFRLLWTLSDQPVGATLLSYRPASGEDGYFLLLASPEVKAGDEKIVHKTVIFALDRSGSMAGQKIEQARNALKFVLNNLRESDTFNIIAYDDRVESFKPELQRFNSETRQEALRFIDGIYDGGSTNIDGALRRAFELAGDTGRATYVIFLTDGLPTAGQTNELKIAEGARNANRAKSRLFAFGVGFDVNARLLDRLSTDGGGTTEYVKPNDNIESAIAQFYGKMTAPILTGIQLELAGADINRLYPADLPDLFAGGQIVCVGRFRNSGDATIRLRGRIGQKEEVFSFPATLARQSSDETYAFIERLWATRRVGEILNELDLKGRNQELVDELLRLSTRHGILTPYTAFLADERTDLHAGLENSSRVGEAVFDNKATSFSGNTVGMRSQNLRNYKKDYQNFGGGNGDFLYQSNPRALVAGPTTLPAGAQAWQDADGNVRFERGVQVVGNKALYRRSNRWVDPSVTPVEEQAAEQVEQFSDRYFELARSNTALRQYLALPDGCTVRVDGRVYQINAPQQRGG